MPNCARFFQRGMDRPRCSSTAGKRHSIGGQRPNTQRDSSKSSLRTYERARKGGYNRQSEEEHGRPCSTGGSTKTQWTAGILPEGSANRRIRSRDGSRRRAVWSMPALAPTLERAHRVGDAKTRLATTCSGSFDSQQHPRRDDGSLTPVAGNARLAALQLAMEGRRWVAHRGLRLAASDIVAVRSERSSLAAKWRWSVADGLLQGEEGAAEGVAPYAHGHRPRARTQAINTQAPTKTRRDVWTTSN